MDKGSPIMIVDEESECTSFSSTIFLLFGRMNGGIEVILLTLKHSNLNFPHLFHPSLILFCTLLDWILQHVAFNFRKYKCRTINSMRVSYESDTTEEVPFRTVT